MTASSSRIYASAQLADLAEILIGPKRCERIVERVGKERVTEREVRLAAYEALSLPLQRTCAPDAPLGSWDHRVAVVMIDGGRAQLRDAHWGQSRQPGEKKPRWWRESKAALVATFSSLPQEFDPLPEVPANLLNPLWLIPKINALKAAKGGESAAEELNGNALAEVDSAAIAVLQPSDRERQRWSPQPLVRSVVATFEPYAKLGRLAKAETYHRGFTAATRRAFLADGLASNWTVHKTHFSSYTPIVDLLHALSYVYQAAQVASLDMEECWQRCQAWITWTWQGKVAHAIAEIDELMAQTQEDAVLETLRESQRYLENNRERMRYDVYRQQGLPITTALMESTIKRINRRMKGTEKFWRHGAEPHLQLCADKISETQPLETFWKNRQEKQTGKRKSRAKA